MELKIPRTDELSQRLQDAGMNVLTYRIRWGQYALQLDKEDLEVRLDPLRGDPTRSRDLRVVDPAGRHVSGDRA